MLIGIDLDNTIVCYDRIIHAAAVDRKLIPLGVPVSKGAVRDHLRHAGTEEAWTELQGHVYGLGMRDATPFPGVAEFLGRCVNLGIRTCIISHRTRRPFRGPPYDLHLAAREWLESHGFFDETRIGLRQDRVYLELTKEDKLRRIAQLGCDRFVDDLPEFLDEPAFPKGVRRILFDPTNAYQRRQSCRRVSSWKQISAFLD